jgi:hypothetical protein
MAHHKLPQVKLTLLQEGRSFKDKQAWEEYLDSMGISAPRHRLIAPEGALVGSLLARGLAVARDDAGQFKVFRHALGWIHAERNLNKWVPLNDPHLKQIAWVRCQIWALYADLKAYKTDPGLQTPSFRAEIRQRFQELCRTRTPYQTLNGHLKRLLASQDELAAGTGRSPPTLAQQPQRT